MLHRARELLAQGESVVLDASWVRAGDRARAAEAARAVHSELVALRCAAPAEVAAGRIRSRHGGISDADPRIAAAMSADADVWPEATTVDTTTSPEESLAAALRVLSA
ncbi:AAA family ATPase [Prauserella muralis]|uniref:AAA family ATPase n=1 Tax=Prauserella muralis TaxID=588067 RepID=UPI00319DBAC7